MAIQTRYAGDATGINNFDGAYDGTLGTLIATGATKSPTAISIVLGKSQTFSAADSATGGVVETFLRQLAIDGTIIAYQVNSGTLSVLLEATGAGTSSGGVVTGVATALQTRIQSLGNASVGAGGSNIWANAATVTNVGLKLATS
jgi:hypothetical protein